ncbi:MAG: hypothetical protein ACTIJ6_06480 [Leucobacter sp.]
MRSKNPDIAARLQRHPDILMHRSQAILAIGIGVGILILIGWVMLLVNASEIRAEFAENQDAAVTLNQRVGSRFGVLIGVIALPCIALLPMLLGWFLSPRFFCKATGTRLIRGYRGIFPGTTVQGADFQNLLRTRDASVIGPMNAEAERGNLIVEGWIAAADKVGYVGTYAFDLRDDPHWEIVEFSGPDFAAYQQIFGTGRAVQ